MYIDMDNIYINLKNNFKDRLIRDLKNDKDFKNLNIDNLIEHSVSRILDSDINFDRIIIREEPRDQIILQIFNKYLNELSLQQKRKINDIIKNIDKPDNIYIKIMLDYILVSKDNSTIVVDNEMDIDNMFQETFKKVFNDKIENRQALKVKKCRLRKKILNKVDPNEQERKDYEFIMFKYIMDMSYDISF